MSAHDGGVEHLKEMRRGAHGRERVEEGFENAGLAQAIEALPHAVPRTEALRQRAPANVLDGEEMKRLEEAAVVVGFPAATGQTGPEHRKRVRPIVLDMDPGPRFGRSPMNHVRFTSGIPKMPSLQNSSTRPNSATDR